MGSHIIQALFVFTAAVCFLMKLMMVLDFTVGDFWAADPNKVMRLKHACITEAHSESGIQKYS